MKKNLWAIISIIVVPLSVGAYFLYDTFSDPVFVQVAEDTTLDSKVPLAERIEKWRKVLDDKAEKVNRSDIPDANARMAELCNSAGFSIADQCKRSKFGRNNILVAIWMYRNAEMYADKLRVTERSVDARKSAESLIKGLTEDYKLSESELQQVEVRMERLQGGE